jgi:hypothetical protein
MSDARGSQREIRYVAEANWSVTPETPAMKVLRTVSDTLAMTKQTLQSAELRADRQISDFRHGNRQAGGEIGIEFSYESFDDFLESALFGTWATPYNVSTQDIDVNATAKTFTRAAGSYITDGVLVGDPITFSGYTNPGNNGTFIVSAVEALIVTCSTATGLTTEEGTGNEAFTTTRKRLVVGTTLKSFTVEKAHEDISEYLHFTGMAVSSLRLSIAPNAMVTGSFTLVGKDMAVGTELDSEPTAAPTGSPFDSFTGSLEEGGSAIAIVTALDLNLDNGLEAKFAVMSATARSVLDKRSNLTGTLSVYFTDETMLNKFINETESSLELVLTDLDGDSYRIMIPRLKYGGADLPVSGEGEIIQSMPFQALYDSTEETNLIIDKIPAVA